MDFINKEAYLTFQAFVNPQFSNSVLYLGPQCLICSSPNIILHANCSYCKSCGRRFFGIKNGKTEQLLYTFIFVCESVPLNGKMRYRWKLWNGEDSEKVKVVFT